MAERIHITTAIFYCNGTPHVGSAYEALAADVFARYQRRKLGRENVSFLSGTDEHGDKIRRAALAAGAQTAGLHRQDERAVRRGVPRPQRQLRLLGAHHRRGPSEVGAADAAAHARARRHLLSRLRGTLLRRLRALLHRKGIAARQHLSHAQPPGRADQRGQLLPADREVSRAGARTHPAQSRFHPARALPQRGAQHALRAAERSLHLAAQGAPGLGNRAAVRRQVRHLRLVRRVLGVRQRIRRPTIPTSSRRCGPTPSISSARIFSRPTRCTGRRSCLRPGCRCSSISTSTDGSISAARGCRRVRATCAIRSRTSRLSAPTCCATS